MSGLGPAKVAQIKAAFELGKRICAGRLTAPTFESSKAVAHHFRPRFTGRRQEIGDGHDFMHFIFAEREYPAPFETGIGNSQLADKGLEAPASQLRESHQPNVLAHFRLLCLDVERPEALDSGSPEQAFVSRRKCDLFSQSGPETEGRSEMDGIEPSQGVTADQIASHDKDLILEIHSNVGLPVALKMPAGQGILAAGQMAYSVFPPQACIDLHVGDLHCRDGTLLGDKALNQWRPLYRPRTAR